ncbi:mucin-1 [Biomphalaria glabrata]|uniref:Cyclin-T-like isoform X1 n=2 Tax=Biomphalaria glabrata TaxID=6526 RepID=A0A9W2YBV4_BIOGL|nr:cyclin-T-like isoform X1 [Biomphalaria glabrata]
MLQASASHTMANAATPALYQHSQPSYDLLVMIDQPYGGQPQLARINFVAESQPSRGLANSHHVVVPAASKAPSFSVGHSSGTSSSSKISFISSSETKAISTLPLPASINKYLPSVKQQPKFEQEFKKPDQVVNSNGVSTQAVPSLVASTPKPITNVVLEGPLQVLDPTKLPFVQTERRSKLTTKELKPRPTTKELKPRPTTKDLKPRPRTASQTSSSDDVKPAPGLQRVPSSGPYSVAPANPQKSLDRRSSFPLPNVKEVKKPECSLELTTLLNEQKKLLDTVKSVSTAKQDTQKAQMWSSTDDETSCDTNSIPDLDQVNIEEENEEEISEYDKMKNMEDLSCNFKWLFSEEKLQNTPSVESGISLEQELTFRQKQAMLIQTIGLKSGLTQLAVNTSVIFMHRFYMFRTVKDFPRVHLALGFAFAGGKVEESARKLEHLIRTAIEIIKSNKNREFLDRNDPLTYELDSQWRGKMEALIQNSCNIESTAYQEMRKLVLECETEIYAVIGFQLQIVHPHNYVIRMCALLGAENIKDISQYAYNLATASSQLTMLCLKYKPETIATMCLNIASKAHSVRFVSMKDPNVKWYQVLHSQTDIAEIESVSEEFLNLIKGCPLLPSWMTNLSRMSRTANNNRPQAAAAPRAGPSTAPPGTKPSQIPGTSSGAAAAASSVSHPSSSSSLATHPARPLQQNVDISQTSSTGQEAAGSPNGKQGTTAGDSGLGAAASIGQSKDSSHSRAQNAQMRPPTSSSAPAPPNNHQQQHRSHPSGRPQNPTPSVPPGTSSKPQPRHPGASAPSSRPSNQHHTTHSSSHTSSRPTSDPSRHHADPGKPHDPSRSHDHSRINHDVSKQKDPHRHQDPARHTQPRPEGQPDSGSKSQPSREESIALRHQQAKSAADYISAQESTEQPFSTSPSAPTQSPPEFDANAIVNSSEIAKAPSHSTPPEQKVKSSDSSSQLQQQASKLSLSMYRERAKSKAANESLSVVEDSSQVPVMAEDTVFDALAGSTNNSPVEKSLKLSAANTPQNMDSPNAPSLKIKVKLDPSGERHYVKNTEPSLKLKIKPLKSDTADGDHVPGGSKMSSRSNTPFEEGEIIDESSPSLSSLEKKSEGLKIRLSVPRSGDSSSSYSRRESDHSSNGHERESHRSHHHGHHSRSHHHKSKKHSSKHDRSRHESKSSKRSAPDYLEERPSKAMRLETSGRHHENVSSQVLQHQNSGFSINDAFSSTLPNNIFDDDDEDDGSHAHPPITPPPDLMYRQSRQKLEYKRPPLPKGLPPPSPPPPPPSPPTL